MPTTQQQSQKMARRILERWKEQRYCIRFLDGNKLNCQVNNLKWVSHLDALRNIDVWVTDWDANLTKKQKEFVLTEPNIKNFIQLLKE